MPEALRADFQVHVKRLDVCFDEAAVRLRILEDLCAALCHAVPRRAVPRSATLATLLSSSVGERRTRFLILVRSGINWVVPFRSQGSKDSTLYSREVQRLADVSRPGSRLAADVARGLAQHLADGHENLGEVGEGLVIERSNGPVENLVVHSIDKLVAGEDPRASAENSVILDQLRDPLLKRLIFGE